MGQNKSRPLHPKCVLHTTPREDYFTKDGLPNSVRKNGRFIIPWECDSLPSLKEVIKLRSTPKPHQLPNTEELDKNLPVVKPDHDKIVLPPESGICITWLGHASCLVQFDDITVLADPIFSTRCSPVQFIGPKRYRDPPCNIQELPKIDAVIISHNHYDHLDYNTVKKLNERFGEELRWYVPLGMAHWMYSSGCGNVFEMDWWEENYFSESKKVKFVFTPTQHWSKRSITDDNKMLWGSWCIIGPKNRFYFAGDTGYCEVFKQIGKKYGPFDLSAIPIGAYEPRSFMHFQHIDPQQAVKVHKDIMSKKSLGIHWGTFDTMSQEHYLDPPKVIHETMKDEGLPTEDFFCLNHGESRLIAEN